MTSPFEIVILEYSDVYGCNDVYGCPVEAFIQTCHKYVSPKYIEKSDVYLTRTRNLISYADRSGDDKPRTVMLIGSNIPSEMYAEIEKRLKQFYEDSNNSDDEC